MYNKKGFWIGVLLFVLNSVLTVAQNLRTSDQGARQALRIFSLPGMSTLIFLFLLGTLLFYFGQFLWHKFSGDAKGYKKLISVSGSLLIIFAYFFVGGGVNIITKMQELAGTIRFLIAIMFGVLTFFAVRGKYTEEGGMRNGLSIILGFVVMGLFMGLGSLGTGESFPWGVKYIIFPIVILYLTVGFLFSGKGWRHLNPLTPIGGILKRIPSKPFSEFLNEVDRVVGSKKNLNEAKSAFEEVQWLVDTTETEILDFNKLKEISRDKNEKLIRAIRAWHSASTNVGEIKRITRFTGKKHIWLKTNLLKMIERQISLVNNIIYRLPVHDDFAAAYNGGKGEFNLAQLDALFASFGREGFSQDSSKYKERELERIWNEYQKRAKDLKNIFETLVKEDENAIPFRGANIKPPLFNQKKHVKEHVNEALKFMEDDQINEFFDLIRNETTLINLAAQEENLMGIALLKIRNKIENIKGDGGTNSGDLADQIGVELPP